MTRAMTSGMTNAVVSAAVMPILLVEALFDSGATRMWSGYGTLTWGGYEWLGAGHLLSISEMTETQELRATGATIGLSGIPSDLLALALAEPYQGRLVKIYIGAMDSAGAVIADPYQIFAGRCDTVEISEGSDTSTITVSVESRLIDLERARARRYEHIDQQIDYPDDKGLEYVSSIQDMEITWGRQ